MLPAVRALAVASLLMAAVSSAENPRPNPFLAQARVFYQGGEFEKCLRRLKQAQSVRAPSTPAEAAEIALYFGLCEINLGREDVARGHFEAAVAADPSVALPPFTSPKVKLVFESVVAARGTQDRGGPAHAEAAPRPSPPAPREAARDAPTRPSLEAPAELPTPLVGAAGPPPATGGLLAGKSLVLPIALGSVGLAAGGASAYFGFSSRRLASEAQGATFAADARMRHADAERAALLANIGIGVAVLALGGATAALVF